MYFSHQSEFNQHSPVRHMMNRSVQNPLVNSSPYSHPVHANMYSHSYVPVVQQFSNPPMSQPVLQLPTHPAQQRKRLPGSNLVQNNQYQYPPVDADLLHQSANETQKIMADASKVLNKFATSKEFGEKLMETAQQSKTEEVKQLIASIGVESDVKVRYNPDGLHLEFTSKIAKDECCKLNIVLRWR